jgi:putative ABC transport system ATP-binding protein
MIIDVTNLSKTYKTGAAAALDNIHFQCEAGEFIVITGESGSGKSTLINILALLDSEFTGTYLFDGLNINDLSDSYLAHIRNERTGYIFQDYKLIYTMTNEENILLPHKYASKEGKENAASLSELASLLKIEPLLSKYPSELSGGQRQRVAIARALIMNPRIIFADEPTAALDPGNTKVIYELLQELNNLGHTIIIASHDFDSLNYCTRHIQITED